MIASILPFALGPPCRRWRQKSRPRRPLRRCARPLAEIALRRQVTELDRLMRAGRGAGWHRRRGRANRHREMKSASTVGLPRLSRTSAADDFVLEMSVIVLPDVLARFRGGSTGADGPCHAPRRQGRVALKWQENRSSSAVRCRSPPRPTMPRSTGVGELRTPTPRLCRARFTAPEFTTLCPVTGQPDFAHLVIDYVPGKGWWSQGNRGSSTLTSFRNHGSLPRRAAPCYRQNGSRTSLGPRWLSGSAAHWYPRGGMPIDVFWQTGKLRRKASGCRNRVSRPRGR